MAKKDYQVRLEGVEAFDLSLAVLRDLADVFVEGAARCARLAAEGRSVARGASPAWVAAAADLRVTRYGAGSLIVDVQARRLCEIAPDIFAQQALFPGGADPDASAFDLLLDAAGDAASSRRDSDRLDAGVLEVLLRAGNLFARGGTRLTVTRPQHEKVVLDPAALQTIRALADETPAARISRVRGILDSLTFSTKTAIIRLEDGPVLRGYAGSVNFDSLRDLLGKDVLIEGLVTFRPSGDALRIDIESIAAAKPGDAIWAKLPRAEAPSARPRPSIGATGLDALFGAWPGDETDDDLAVALSAS